VTTREPAATLPTPIVKDTTTPITPTPVVRPPTTPEKKSSAGLLIVGLLVVAAVAAALYYFLVMNQPAAPSALGVSVSIAKPEDVARSFPTAAVVKKAEPQTLKIDGAGVVSKVVDENADVQPDTVLVQLDSQVKLNKELTELRDRLNVYQKKLDSPKTKSKPDQLRDAQQKITEKQQRLEVVEGLIKKAQLTAPRPGTVSKVMVKVGQSVTAGTEVVSLADKALAAEIKIPAIEAQGMKVGQDAQLAGAAGPLAVKVSSLRTEGDYAMVSFLLPDNATAKAGDELKLQKAPLSQVVRLPATALVDGGKVFVLRDGKAATLAVTVADREGDAVLLQGLPSGEQVIVAHPSELHEGSAARVATPGSP
jgi:multidrug efflux pump subunit AcrA (membrane-fusion protein)